MKPRVREKILEIEHAIDRLRLTAESAVDQIKTAQDAQEEMRKDHWRQRKEIATLSRSADEFTALQNENTQLRESLGQLRNTLQTLLANIKTLRSEYRS